MRTPDGLAYTAAAALAVVLAVAAGAKWRDPAGTARGFRALGVPRPWPAARIVPAVEASTALALITVPAVGATAAMALLAGFSVFLAARVRAGVTASCRCFGGRAGHDLSWADLVRNAWLLAAGAVAVTAPGPVVPTPSAVGAVVLAGVVAAGTVRAARTVVQRARTR